MTQPSPKDMETALRVRAVAVACELYGCNGRQAELTYGADIALIFTALQTSAYQAEAHGRAEELSADDAALIRQLWAENKHDNHARTVTTSDAGLAQAMRLSEFGMVGLEQLGCGLRLHPTRLGLRSLPENASAIRARKDQG